MDGVRITSWCAEERLPAPVHRGLQRPARGPRRRRCSAGPPRHWRARWDPTSCGRVAHLLLVRGQEAERAQHLERLVGAGAVGRRVLGAGEDVAEQAGLLGEDLGDVALGRREAEIRRQRDAQARQVDRRRGGEIRRRAGWSRRAPWWPADRVHRRRPWPTAAAPGRGRCAPSGPAPTGCSSPGARRSDGTRPGVGRNPTMPQNAAGLRRLPPVSEPVQSGAIPVASATAEPPEEPAQDFSGRTGCRWRRRPRCACWRRRRTPACWSCR